jgi:hypothetical protein
MSLLATTYIILTAVTLSAIICSSHASEVPQEPANFEPKRGIYVGTNVWNHSPIEAKLLQRVVSPRRLLLKSTRYS